MTTLISLIKLTPAWVLSSTLAWSASVYAPVPAPSGLVVPAKKTTDRAGNRYSFSDYELIKTTSSGVSTVIASAEIAHPALDVNVKSYQFTDVVVDAADTVYAAETDVLKFGLAGELILKLPSSGPSSLVAVPIREGDLRARCEVAVDSRGVLYSVAPDLSVVRIETDGEVTAIAPLHWFSQPTGARQAPSLLAVDEQDRVFVQGYLYPTRYFGPILLVPLRDAPTLTGQPTDHEVSYGGKVRLRVDAVSSLPITYQWQREGINIPGAANADFDATLPGVYTAVVSTGAGSVTSASATVSLGNRLLNLSSRAALSAGEAPCIAGFILKGDPAVPKKVLVRAVGPGLRSFGVPEFSAKPSLSVFDEQGRLIAANAGWSDAPEISAANAQVGAFPFESGSRDAAMVLTLLPGRYTAHLTGAEGTSGVALAEVYELASDPQHFINLSTRAKVGTGANLLIGGFMSTGRLPTKVLVRAVGPGLATYGVTAVLKKPILAIYDSAGQLLASNQGWTQGGAAEAAALAEAAVATGAFPLQPGSLDCAAILTLPPGSYTAHVSGVDGETGTTLLEVYQLPE